MPLAVVQPNGHLFACSAVRLGCSVAAEAVSAQFLKIIVTRMLFPLPAGSTSQSRVEKGGDKTPLGAQLSAASLPTHYKYWHARQ